VKASNDRRAVSNSQIQPVKGDDMLKNRLLLVFMAIAVVVLSAFTIREAVAVTLIGSESGNPLTCESLPSRHSIRAEYDEEAGMRIIRTEDGPTGMDGGLKTLLSDYRTCSR